GMCELRSGLRFVSTAGNRARRMRGRRGRGVPSFLVTSFWASRKKLLGRQAETLLLQKRPPATGKDRGRSPLPQQREATSEQRSAIGDQRSAISDQQRSRAEPAPTTAKSDQRTAISDQRPATTNQQGS